MKKILFFVSAAALLTACSSEELSSVNDQNKAQQAVNFEVYTQRSITRAGTPGGNNAADEEEPDYGVTTTSLKTGNHKDGFGVFGFYTNDTNYNQDESTPNFMYNQQVEWSENKSVWTYEPVKYWPNEFGNDAASEETDYLTFFAYAPWTKVNVATGVPDADASNADQVQQLNITQISKNTATGDPIIKYVVDTKPKTSVDLLWGVAAVDGGAELTADDFASGGTQYQPIQGANSVKAGACFVDLVKEKMSKDGKVAWNFKHALARLNVQIIAVVDTPTEEAHETNSDVKIGTDADGTVDGKTNVWVRSISLSGFATKGALNLYSESDNVSTVADAQPNWKGYDGVTELAFEEAVTFYDGLKDGKERTANNIQKNEKPTGLNPIITAEKPETDLPTDKFVNLWDGAETAEDPIYVIPSNEQMDITIVYDIETEDENLAGFLSDGTTHGSVIENKIQKLKVFDKIEPGKAYVVKIYVGLTSVKFEAVVTPWDVQEAVDIDLPKNGGETTGGGSSTPEPEPEP